MELQQGEFKKKRGVRLGAGGLMTFKEGKSLPEHALNQELAKLEHLRQRAEIIHKRDEALMEAILYQILDSLGNYANLATREDIHRELQKELVKSLVSTKRAEPTAPVLPDGDVENESEGEHKNKIGNEAKRREKEKEKEEENEVWKKIKKAEKRKQEKLRSLKPSKKRPSYRAIIQAEQQDRKRTNEVSFVKLLELYGREKDPRRIDFWLECLYPGIGEQSINICGIKKRLERYKNRLLMETDPRDYGREWFFTESLVGHRYPETIKLKAPRFLPPINLTGNLIAQSGSTSESCTSDDNLDSKKKSRNKSIGRLRKEPISAGEFLRGETPKKSSVKRSDSLESIDTVKDAQDNETDKEVKNMREKLALIEPKSMLSIPEKQPHEKVKKVSIKAPDIEEEQDVEDRRKISSDANKRRRSSVSQINLIQRKKTMALKEDQDRIERIEQLKGEVLRAAKLKSEGRENEIDWNIYFQRRRSLALLLNDDETIDIVAEGEHKKTWEEVQKCKYIRGYEPPEMRDLGNDQLGEFVFWKGEFNEEEEFITERKAKDSEMEVQEPTPEVDLTKRRKSVSERRLSVVSGALEKTSSKN